MDVELAEVRTFLAGNAPFDVLPPGVLDGLVRRLRLRYHRRGTALIARGRDNAHLYVIRSGAADIRDGEGTLVERIAEGGCAGSITLVEGNPSTFEVTAIEDTLAIVMDAATFAELCGAHPAFADFFDRQRRERMRGAVTALHAAPEGGAALRTAVRDLLGRAPVTVDAGATVREAAAVMDEARVSCVLVMTGDRLAGILTDRDLRRVVASGGDPAGPVLDVMTSEPVTAAADAQAFELLLTMVSRMIHHLPVVADGRVVGVVTATDLMRLEHANPSFLAREVVRQASVEGVAAVARRLPEVVEGLVAQDASADDVGRIVTAIGDAVEQRVIALALDRLGPAPAAWCWVTLGSRARLEQGLAADQDNALILADGAEAHDAWFAAFAEEVVAGLEACGYPRCPGDVMATTPGWRVPLGTWRRQFGRWLDEPTPEAVLRASVFFDMRPVAGEVALHDELAAFVLRRTPTSDRFLTHLSRDAAEHSPPLGFFRGLVVEREGDHARTLDIKKGGVSPVVKLARVHALRAGSPARSTRARIQVAADAGLLSAATGEDLRDAFEFISYVRLRHQAALVRTGRDADNHVDPRDLSGFEQRHLREAFGIIRHAQGTLSATVPGGFLP